MSASNGNREGDVTPDAEIYCMGKYRVVAASAGQEDAPESSATWKCLDAIQGIGEVFTGYEFSGEQDWNEDSVNLTLASNAEMTVKFSVPEDPDMFKEESTELFLLIGLNWLSESDDCKFVVEING